MVIAHVGSSALVRLTGRLDGERSRHLADTLDELLRDGLRSVVLDMSQVSYVSTAGTHVLGQRYRDFSTLRGELRVSAPSPEVLTALTTAGLLDHLLLLPGDDRVAGGPGRPSAAFTRASGEFTGDSWQVPSDAPHAGHYEVSRRNTGGALECRMYGRPDAFAQGYVAAECRPVAFPVHAFGLGIGAIGRDFDECRGRFGELLGVAGAVAYLPTDGALVPDYQLGGPDEPPLALVGTGLVCDGNFSNLIRFRAQPGAGAVPLSEVAAMALSTSESPVAGLVIAAEATELVLASLRRSPASLGEPLEFDAGAVREWLAFTAERTQSPRTALIAGVVAREAPPALGEFLRPLGGPEGLLGHFHAMGFAYRPVPQRTVSLRALVDKLLETQPLRAVGHVVADDRGADSAGQTTLLRGLCWTAPITAVGPAA
jgi:anti-anti-sigma factor